MSNQTDDDFSFMAEMGDVRPLSQDKVNSHSASRSLADKQKANVSQNVQRKNTNPLTLSNVSLVNPDDFLSYKQPGIQEGVFKNLRLGKYAIDFSLSLNGLNLEMAANAMYNAIQDSHSKGHRAILIRHGKGENSKPFPAFKKSFVNHWLKELDEVIAFHSAQPQHGGLGATYVLLKKHPDQKLINREKNRRR